MVQYNLFLLVYFLINLFRTQVGSLDDPHFIVITIQKCDHGCTRVFISFPGKKGFFFDVDLIGCKFHKHRAGFDGIQFVFEKTTSLRLMYKIFFLHLKPVSEINFLESYIKLFSRYIKLFGRSIVIVSGGLFLLVKSSYFYGKAYYSLTI